ncbi:Predicted arabinose efflux permease, MFS family [Belliella buryatensis]|uniref:Predicted arabinose efflux permease, MFS family n=1 Tax=Belliella buryatensis TaxID=1500549 RepID=A0A239EY28_9BACT|nr:MFS transporter [Belliella buryatensis]SNS49660.1 Predicted arabinose efflux permease, MFS family [Belliella buryatensis]
MKHILPTIVIAQFLCTSLWFAGNAVLPELAAAMQLPSSYLGHLTSAVQIGFIGGTLIFAILTIADKFSPSKVFLISALIAAAFNWMMVFPNVEAWQLLLYRFGAGFFLAGIYPVGMKIAADYFEKGLGQSLGFLVGALVLGTAFPHLVRSLTDSFPWEFAIYSTSILAIFGGLLIYFLVPDGPFRKPGATFNPSAFIKVFEIKNFRNAAFGYFGHMWELYAFWAFIPVILAYLAGNQNLNIPFWSFLIIAVGGISCALGGMISKVIPPKKIAFSALALSGICCLLSPFILSIPNLYFTLFFLLIWGLAVTADSPMFSTLVAQNAPSASKGTSLTIVNSIGFGITILSIQLLNFLAQSIPTQYLFLILALGPLLGLIATAKIKTQH